MSINAVTLPEIRSADWSLMLDSTAVQLGLNTGLGRVVEGIADVNQCISIILTTPPGSDPLRPTFGTNLLQFIDYPADAAIPQIVREVTDSLSKWEPRLKLLRVSANLVPHDPSANFGAHLGVTVSWRLNLKSPTTQQSTTVTIFAGALG